MLRAFLDLARYAVRDIIIPAIKEHRRNRVSEALNSTAAGRAAHEASKNAGSSVKKP